MRGTKEEISQTLGMSPKRADELEEKIFELVEKHQYTDNHAELVKDIHAMREEINNPLHLLFIALMTGGIFGELDNTAQGIHIEVHQVGPGISVN